ncbi:MAG: acetyltransferase [Mariprofundaceae bacterium]|nr:acetyltransferase [Mariprofundaceae bacterium]
MAHFDVFNGDADGLCALHQLRLAEPCEAELVTGVKRDIALLNRVNAGVGDVLTVLDISLDKNRDGLLRLLDSGAQVTYFDHHFAGDIPESANLHAHIDTSPDVCSSLLVNRHLGGRFLAWAVTAAFGDNLHDAAQQAAIPLSLNSQQLEKLCALGECLNYNGYGVSEDDLYFHPAVLYRRMQAFVDPFAFIAEDDAFTVLQAGMHDDLAQARAVAAESESEHAALFLLANSPWARRVSGVFGNELARGFPERAHAVAMQLDDGSYRISVRSPLTRKQGADALCRAFPTGGGRAAAAGINALPADQMDAFVAAFQRQYGG